MRWAALFAALACAAAASETPESPDSPYAGTWPEIFTRFDHARHERPLRRAELPCAACHRVGASTSDPLIPPPGACHYCHNPPAGERRVGPGACGTCHDDVRPPPTHGAGWVADHGAFARDDRKACASCHAPSQCVDCHERKEGVRFAVHDRTWLSVHGIAALAGPAECSSCHLQADCVACHSTADGRRP